MRLATAPVFGLLLGLVLTSCASAPAPPLSELTMLSVEEVDYDYKFGDPRPEFDLGFDLEFGMDDEPSEDLPIVEIEVTAFVVDRESSNGIDPEHPLGSAFLTTREDAERFAAEAKGTTRASLANRQLLSCYENQRVYASIMNQTAYISSFEMDQGEFSVIADPVIDVLQEGSLLRLVSPSVSGDSVTLEATLLTSQADKPFPTVRWIPVAGTSPVEIQRPVVASQELSFDAELGPDQVLVVKCENPNDRNSRLLFFISAKSL